MRLLARTDKIMHKGCGFFCEFNKKRVFVSVKKSFFKYRFLPQNRHLYFLKHCEFFVTAKNIKRKQYVNKFLL